MIRDLSSPLVRRTRRTLALAPVLLVPMLAGPAVAAPPETWPETESVGALDFLLLIVAIPLGLALVIAVLASVPSLVRGDRYTPGLAWRNENEWFGGPRDGLDAADRTDPVAIEAGEETRGGASVRW